jgi:sulfide:quinone oxidoreductase
MKRLVILGGGTAGTIVANRMRRRFSARELEIVVIDDDDTHWYQPGFLFVPFDDRPQHPPTRPRRRLLRHGIELEVDDVESVLPDENVVVLVAGQRVEYDLLVIATGATPRPEQTPGMLGPLWRTSIFDFYTYDGALALRSALRRLDHGHVVVHVVDSPIKCPVAPLEFAFLLDDYLRQRAARDRVTIEYVTPMSAAFTKPVAAAHLGTMLDERKIALQTDFLIERVDVERRTLVAYDEREVPFDLLVTVPLHMGADFIGRSGLGDELNFVRVDPRTLQVKKHANVFAVGDAANLPTSKAGSVAHFAAHVLVDNLTASLRGRPMTASFDGHANCFVESGDGRGLLIDFNYDVEPLPGHYPLPGIGPFRLLAPSRINHWGKLAFRWLYWHMLLPGRRLPVPNRMSMAGKVPASEETQP